MNKKLDTSNADARYKALQIAKLKAEGWGIHHDNNGWYVVMPNEKEPENGESLGSTTGRTHYPTKKDAWQAIILPDTEPKPRDFLRMFAVLVSIGAALARPFSSPYYGRKRIAEKNRGRISPLLSA